MPEYRPEHERMLWGLGLSGNAFKKVYYDPSIGRQTSIYVPAEDVVVPYGASSLRTCERVTHVMRKTPNELRKLQVSGFYLDVDLGDPVNTIEEVEKKIAEKLGFRATTDDRYKLLEMQVDLDLAGYEDVDDDGEETGIALPYNTEATVSGGQTVSFLPGSLPTEGWRERVIGCAPGQGPAAAGKPACCTSLRAAGDHENPQAAARRARRSALSARPGRAPPRRRP
jgi:hypothetical protein